MAFYDYLGHKPSKVGLFRTGPMLFVDHEGVVWADQPFRLAEAKYAREGIHLSVVISGGGGAFDGKQAGTPTDMLAGLTQSKDMSGVIVVLSGADEASTLQFLAPYTGAAIAEYCIYLGTATCAIYDDLTKQAVAYREMVLLRGKLPAREAYPSDVFYLHARLLERGDKPNGALGGGSMTALPVVETREGDVSAYIPTNVIYMDSQLFFSASLFNEGIRPAINVGISVSRVGSAAQRKLMKQVAGQLKIQQAQLRGLRKQSQGQPYSVLQQVALIYTGIRTDTTAGSVQRLILSQMDYRARMWQASMRQYIPATTTAIQDDPTNPTVASAEKGQLFFSASLFNEGIRPAINVGISVTKPSQGQPYSVLQQVALIYTESALRSLI